MKWLIAVIIGLSLAAVPGWALAAPGDDDDGDLLMRIGGDVVINSDESIGAVIVIDGNATIDGTVRESVLVIDGDVRVTGTIEGDLTVISGSADLASGSSVDNVTLIRSDYTRAEGATVTGDVNKRENFRVAQGVVALFSFLFWVAMSVAVIASGLIFAAVGGRQLIATAQTMTGDAVNTILGIVFVWVALPIVAGIAIATLIGLPLGFGVLLFLLPALWFLGLIVAGTRLGMAIVKASGREAGPHPYLAAFIGLVILQVLILLPFLGAVVVFFAGIWGAGALAVTAFRGAGFKGFSSEPPASATPPGAQPT
ncbi:MAG: hypothetical protein AB7P33_00760 [Dehalococcoidia bacterium]